MPIYESPKLGKLYGNKFDEPTCNCSGFFQNDEDWDEPVAETLGILSSLLEG